MKPVKITDRNIMFTEPMGQEYDLNMGLIFGNRHNFVIDTGLGSGSVAPLLKHLEGNKKPIVVINTHSDWDHIWGNWVFKDSIIISHIKCHELMEKHWDEAVRELAQRIDGEVYKCLPNMVFNDSLCFPDDGIEIFYSPGHTIGDISVYDVKDKVLYAGDNIGDTADAIVPYINTDIETFKGLITLYKKFDFDICISGHNKPQGKNITTLMEAALEDSWRRQIE